MQENEIHYRKQRSKMGRWAAFILVLLFLGGYGLYTMRKNVVSAKPAEIEGYQVWKDKALDASRDIAVQDGGRIKPFSTWAGFTMLKLHGARSMKISVDGEKVKLGPEAVLLDCLFRPEMAKDLPIFRIDDANVITTLATHDLPEEVRRASGIDDASLEAAVKELEKKKNRRDRYSYNELEPIAPALLAKVQQIRKNQPEKAKMTSDHRRTVDLGEKVWMFMQLIYHMDFARADVEIKEGTPVVDKKSMQRMSYWIRSFPLLADAVRQMDPTGQKLPPHLRSLFSDLELRMRRSSENINILPPYEEDEKVWLPVGKRIEKVVSGNREHADELIADMEMLEDATIALREKGQSAFADELNEWKKSVHGRIGKDATSKLSTEVAYAKMDYFFRSLVIFIFAFILIMFGWLAPRSLGAKICNILAAGLAVIALALMIAGITHRCIIMERSPVGNLYDTILFIATTGVLVLLLVELMTRRAVALGLAVFMGLACMFLARRYEIGDAKDHMDPLVAVLKSNFWLSTHVVTVTIGYMGGLAAAGLSVIYLFARVLGIDEGDAKFRRAMTRIAYGMVCFTLFFSLIGTVLGGIWANDSWGRFWGWDPKENGALMIVLWCLVVLHARLAGYLREWGIHIAAVFGANIVAFSWWHVNSLSTGLHSYGFIDGLGVIWGFYGLMTGVCLMGMIAAVVTRANKPINQSLEAG
ncbi:cytochrome c biogenesis protein CcsA [Verrucomicrobiaceae bacterium R5-34]|uniref:Cytochrome c biogenesis protein CcsA n=1 Tax=Oceaniferula flava TaxID=2800421 RepID=A0AAE2SBW2_9BACT|nr:cytochrome c biogenesis protein CcsA [Oceaniferula flavus]MBK1830108.1 cytochrome c biogenesis protein CcsA [Verrucomicrobiaceae bacterium R5-34]MBK1855023.1 cytochrome c biogenesis protein CcsA [Oceaniferula flavus]MBM1136329.1 cytochrome c biogenesis protein CcsA [Oceaniferula flavus]